MYGINKKVYTQIKLKLLLFSQHLKNTKKLLSIAYFKKKNFLPLVNDVNRTYFHVNDDSCLKAFADYKWLFNMRYCNIPFCFFCFYKFFINVFYNQFKLCFFK